MLLETHPPCDSVDSSKPLMNRTSQNEGSEQTVADQDSSKSLTLDTIPPASEEVADANSEGNGTTVSVSSKEENRGGKARSSSQKSNFGKEKKDVVAEGRRRRTSSSVEDSKTKNGNSVENNGGDEKKTDGDGTDEVNFDSSSEMSSEEEDLGSEIEAGENEDLTDDDDEEFIIKETKAEEKAKKNAAVPIAEMGEADIDPTEVECILTDSSDDDGDCDNFNDDEELVGVEADSDEPSTIFESIKVKEEPGSKHLRSQRDKSDGNLENVDLLERTMQELFKEDTSQDTVLDSNKPTVKVKQEPQEESSNQNSRSKLRRKGIVCEICHGKFSMKEGPRQLLDHLNSLHGFIISAYCAPKEFVCGMRGCREVFSTQGSLSYHLSEVHQQEQKIIDAESFRIFQCPYCGIHSTSKVAMRQHVFAYHREKYLSENPIEDLAHRCRYCARLFWRTEDRDDHQVDVHKDKMDNFFKCYVCSHLFSSKVSFVSVLRLCTILLGYEHDSHPKSRFLSQGCARSFHIIYAYFVIIL
jgi:hypothetical protein